MKQPPDQNSRRTEVHRVEHDWSDPPPVGHVIVEGISRLEGTSETDLEPLYNCVDPEALEALLQGGASARGNDVRISFLYEGYRVMVSADGEILVESEAEE